MPTSEVANVPPIIHAVQRLQPKRVLELGVGSGKYGVLLREYLDIGQGRYKPEMFTTEILGVEGFEHYLNSLHDYAYSAVLMEDFSDPMNWYEYRKFDLVLMVDSLEHVEKELGKQLLEHLVTTNKSVIVSVPWGSNYLEQGAVYGNEFERHRAHWHPSELERMGGRQLHLGVCAVYQFGERG